jgi:hypothetical protein
MSTISLRLPESLHDKLREQAKRDKVSMNQFITLALAEKLSALAAEEYIQERAKRGDRAKFERAMAKVSDMEPEPRDRL